MSPAETCYSMLEAAFPFAEQMLAEHGEFFPYGAKLLTDGRCLSVAVDVGSDQPDVQQVIDALRQAFIAAADDRNVLATALITDAKIRNATDGTMGDAVVVHFDHRADYSIRLNVPYRLIGNGVVFDEAFMQPGDGAIFPAGTSRPA